MIISSQVALSFKEKDTFPHKGYFLEDLFVICFQIWSERKDEKTFLLEDLIYASETVTELEKSPTQCLSGQGKWWLYFILTRSFIPEASPSVAVISASDLRRGSLYSCMCTIEPRIKKNYFDLPQQLSLYCQQYSLFHTEHSVPP